MSRVRWVSPLLAAERECRRRHDVGCSTPISDAGHLHVWQIAWQPGWDMMMLREECLEDRRHSALRHNECCSLKNFSFAILRRCWVALIKVGPPECWRGEENTSDPVPSSQKKIERESIFLQKSFFSPLTFCREKIFFNHCMFQNAFCHFVKQ